MPSLNFFFVIFDIKFYFFFRSFMVFDVISVIPFYVIQNELLILKFFRLFSMRKIFELSHYILISIATKLGFVTKKFKIILRIIKLINYFLLTCHLASCIILYINRNYSVNSQNYMTNHTNKVTEYINVFYFVISTVTTTG